jgi:hypothetical protein
VKGYTPPITDFGLVTIFGEDQTDQVLNNPGFTMFMVCGKLADIKPEVLDKGFAAGFNCLSNGINFYILTASSADEIMTLDSGFTTFQVDQTTLKTMIRSNPGYFILREGLITAKWPSSRLPDPEDLVEKIENSYPANTLSESLKFIIIITIIILLSFLINIILGRITKKE